MRTHADIVRAAGKAEDVAKRCGVSIHAVRSWIQRDSIPADFWPFFAKGDVRVLGELAAGKRPRRRSDEQAAA